MSRWAILACVTMTILEAGCATVESDDYTVYKRHPEATTLVRKPISVFFSNPEGIEFRGIASNDDNVNSANVLYSGAGGVGGVAAQIAFHAAMVQTAQDRKLEKAREQADLALEPLSEELKALQSSNLASLSLTDQFAVLPLNDTLENQRTHIRSYPVFFVNEDLNNLSVKNVLTLHKAGEPLDQPVYQNLVEVVTDQSMADDNKSALLEVGLERAVKELYRTSMVVGLDDMAGQLEPANEKPKTFRHDVNGVLRIERGVTVKKSCSAVVLRNLRGWLVSLPIEEAGAKCQAAAR